VVDALEREAREGSVEADVEVVKKSSKLKPLGCVSHER
jgi:hypothetical protein